MKFWKSLTKRLATSYRPRDTFRSIGTLYAYSKRHSRELAELREITRTLRRDVARLDKQGQRAVKASQPETAEASKPAEEDINQVIRRLTGQKEVY